MGIHILTDKHYTEGATEAAALYDSVTMWAFGPVFVSDDAYATAERFLHWLTEVACETRDARTIPDNELETLSAQYSRDCRRALELDELRRDVPLPLAYEGVFYRVGMTEEGTDLLNLEPVLPQLTFEGDEPAAIVVPVRRLIQAGLVSEIEPATPRRR